MDIKIFIIAILLIILSTVLVFFYLKSNPTCSNPTCSNPTCSNKPVLGSSIGKPPSSTITYADVVRKFTQSIKELPAGTKINSPDLTFPMVLEALKDPKNVIMPEEMLNMSPQQLASLSDMQLYISNYITSMYLDQHVCLSAYQLMALSPTQILNLNPIQALFGMNQIATMSKNPLTPNQQAAFKQLGM